MATGGDNKGGDGAMGDSATGYDDNHDNNDNG